jgi:membrane-associated protein
MSLLFLLLDGLKHPEGIIRIVGYPGMFAIAFAESGLLMGFFLPGDTMLFLAGFLASLGYFHIVILCVGFTVAGVLGDSVGYITGHKFGRRLFQKKDSLLFKQEHLKQAEAFYEKHGKKTIILARFMPIIRTFAPIVAGMANMHYETFVLYNVVGATLWAVGVTLAGYFLGHLIPPEIMDKYLLLIIVSIVFLSVAPSIMHYIKEKKTPIIP